MDYGHWDISVVGEFDPAEYIGFVYIIEFSDGKKYIGSKKLWKRITVAPVNNKISCTPSHWKHYKSSQPATKYKIGTNKCLVVFKILSLHKTYQETLFAETAEQIKNDVLNNKAFLNDSIASTGSADTLAASLATTRNWKDQKFRKKVCAAQREGKAEYWTKVHMAGVENGTKKFSDYFQYVPTRDEYDQDILDAQIRFENRCKNISTALVGRKVGQESIEKMRQAKLGTEHTNDHRNKIKDSLSGKPKTIEHIKNAMAGRKRDENGKCIRAIVVKVIIDDIEYKSIRDASIQLDTTEYMINKMIKQNKAIVIYKNK